MEHPQNQTVPVNSVARFTCRTTSFVVWQIDAIQISSDSAEDFKKVGITVENENQSVLLVNATLENNGKTILCRTGLNRASLNVTSEVAGTESSSPCDVYQFTATTRNAAGWSDPSNFFSLPSCKLHP